MTTSPEHPPASDPAPTRPGRPVPAESSQLHEPGRTQPIRGWERLLVVLAVCLPVPLFAASGLTIPLPAVVERIAAALVPWADAATLDPNREVGARGMIVLVPEQGPGTESGEQDSTSPEAAPTRLRSGGSERAGGSSSEQTTTQDAGDGVGQAPGGSGSAPTEPHKEPSGDSGGGSSGSSGGGSSGSSGGGSSGSSGGDTTDDSGGGSRDDSGGGSSDDSDEEPSDDSGIVEETVDTVAATTETVVDEVADTADDTLETVEGVVDEVEDALPGLGK